eukprot:CAMPEP_0182595604 /NCGR_PEP_ID=MMETSP1324-20130603/82607_1 /TAXON_ID=236786 /ORGANISM="Florenciella sp., Strain RCC1587" /LENGTH=43 /DNA_ID= /DNA_START= /DNA_END= /DNA_ORIENTATION=
MHRVGQRKTVHGTGWDHKKVALRGVDPDPEVGLVPDIEEALAA